MWFGSNVYEVRYWKSQYNGSTQIFCGSWTRPTLVVEFKTYHINGIWIEPAGTIFHTLRSYQTSVLYLNRNHIALSFLQCTILLWLRAFSCASSFFLFLFLLRTYNVCRFWWKAATVCSTFRLLQERSLCSFSQLITITYYLGEGLSIPFLLL